MKLVRVGAAVLNQTPLAWDDNARNISAAIAEARRRQVSILCLPELCISGYSCEDAFLSTSVAETAAEVLLELAPQTAGMVVSFGLPVVYRNAIFNAACLAVDGRVAGFVAKQHLAGEGIHYEPRWFKPWPAGKRGELLVGGVAYPVGDLYFDCGGVTVGFEICEDAWVAVRPGAALALKGADVLLNPSASHFAFGKLAVRQRFVLEGSRAFSTSYVYANLLGNEAGRAIYDGGAMIASAGRLLAISPRLGLVDHGVTAAVVDVGATRMAQARTASFEPLIGDEGRYRVSCPFAFPELEPRQEEPEVAAWERGPHLKEEELTRAVTLGLLDYLRKSRARGFVVSASGGADSSAVACLVALAVRRGVAELGAGELARRLGRPDLAGAASAAELTRGLLTCVYQATANSTTTTREAARSVAEAIGATFLELEVQGLVDGYVGLVEGAIGRRLGWERDDIALQNVQARVRGPGAWLLANLSGALLLATSNRSEAAVGYATMDGDTCGGLSPIAGVDKAYLRRWLAWLERVGPDGLGPIPALAAVTRQAPTAELRPPEEGQTDEGDLMPYELLDAIERAAIRDKLPPLEVFRSMRVRFAAVDPAMLGAWVERFFRLFARNQWKRERYAPSFHLDDENLDPKTWCRFPILSGGFERELAELRRYLAGEGGGGEVQEHGQDHVHVHVHVHDQDQARGEPGEEER